MDKYKVLIEHTKTSRVYYTVLGHNEADAEYKAIQEAWASKDGVEYKDGLQVKGIVLNEDQ